MAEKTRGQEMLEILSYSKKNVFEEASGEKVKEILNSADINTAIKKGDMDAIKSAVSKALSTDAGKRLAKELSNIMK